MEIKNILGNLNDEQIKELKEALNSNPNAITELLQSRINDKETQEKRKMEEEKDIVAKTKIELENLKKNLSNFDEVEKQIQKFFLEVTSNNESKDLVSKLHDRITAIVIEYIILERKRFEYEKMNDELGFDKYDIQEFFNRMCSLEDQYEILSYLYGELIGLSDEEIINKGKSLENYGACELFNDIKHNGKSLIENINNFYLDYHNGSRFYCVREKNNQLSYPNINKELPRNGIDFYWVRRSNEPREFNRYYPFTSERTDELYDEILMPYYEKFDILDENFFGEIKTTDDYNSVLRSNKILFHNQYEYNITQQLVNEYLQSKENNRQL